MTGLTITKMHRAEHGELDARVTLNGETVPVTRRFGSWGTVPDETGRWRELLPPVAVLLGTRARSFERGEQSNPTGQGV